MSASPPPAQPLTRIASQAERLLVLTGSSLILLFLFGVVADVMSRVLGFSIDWLQEASILTFIWSCFLGAAVGYRRRALYRIDILPRQLPRRVAVPITFVALLLEGLFIWLLLRFGTVFALIGIDRISQPSGMPMVYGFVALPVCAVFLALFYAEKVGDFLCERTGNTGGDGASCI